MAYNCTKAEAARLAARAGTVLQHNLYADEADDVTPKKRDNPEEQAQIALFALRDARVERYPLLRWMFATLNGVYLPAGIKKRVSASGLTRGILDIWLVTPHIDSEGREWKGCAIDLKAKTGKPSPEQLEWADFLMACGWRVYFCGGPPTKNHFLTTLEDAWFTVSAYLGIVGEPAWLSEQEEDYLQELRASKFAARAVKKLTGKTG